MQTRKDSTKCCKDKGSSPCGALCKLVALLAWKKRSSVLSLWGLRIWSLLSHQDAAARQWGRGGSRRSCREKRYWYTLLDSSLLFFPSFFRAGPPRWVHQRFGSKVISSSLCSPPVAAMDRSISDLSLFRSPPVAAINRSISDLSDEGVEYAPTHTQNHGWRGTMWRLHDMKADFLFNLPLSTHVSPPHACKLCAFRLVLFGVFFCLLVCFCLVFCCTAWFLEYYRSKS